MTLEIGSLLKNGSDNSGTIYYTVVAIGKNEYSLKPLIKVRNGFPATRYVSGDNVLALKSEISFNYVEPTKKEIEKINSILAT